MGKQPKTYFRAAALSCAILAGAITGQGGPVQLALWNPVQALDDQERVAGLRLDLLYGCNRDLYGLDLGTANAVKRDCFGIQIGLALNDAGFIHMVPDASGRLAGAQICPVLNTAGEMAGTQVGLVANLTRGSMRGLQLAWLGNIALGDAVGAQVGIGNFTQGGFAGCQLAPSLVLALNMAEEVQGAQISTGLVSLNNAERLAGLQLNLGLLGNHATEMHGVQIAALCNLARRVEGLQVGLVNYCRSLAGVQIGLVNIVAEGGLPVLPVANARW